MQMGSKWKWTIRDQIHLQFAMAQQAILNQHDNV